MRQPPESAIRPSLLVRLAQQPHGFCYSGRTRRATCSSPMARLEALGLSVDVKPTA